MHGLLSQNKGKINQSYSGSWQCAAQVAILPDISDVSKQFEHISDGVMVGTLRREVLYIDGPQVHISTGQRGQWSYPPQPLLVLR